MPSARKQVRVSDAGKLENLRRVDGPRGQNDLARADLMQAAALAKDKAGDAAALEVQAFRFGAAVTTDRLGRPAMPRRKALDVFQRTPFLLVDLEIARAFIGRRC